MVKRYDARFVLVGAVHDADQQLRNNVDTKTVYECLAKRIRFLARSNTERIIRW